MKNINKSPLIVVEKKNRIARLNREMIRKFIPINKYLFLNDWFDKNPANTN